MRTVENKEKFIEPELVVEETVAEITEAQVVDAKLVEVVEIKNTNND